MPLDASTIAKYRQQIASKNRPAALKDIANLHPKNTIPVLIAIIQEAIRKLPAENSVQELRVFLKYAETLLEDLHQKQNASLLQLPSILSEFTKEKITKELTELVNKVEVINMIPEVLEISKEAEIWLEGWYLHTYNMAKKDKNGVPLKDKTGAYNRIDTEDTVYYKVVGMTKLETALYYGKVAELLRKKISSYQEKPVPPVKEVAPVNVASVFDVSVKDGMTTISVTLLSSEVDLIEQIKIAIAAARLPQAVLPSPQVEKPEENKSALPDEADLAKFLSRFTNENQDIKIQMLEHVLNEYELTESQLNLLRNLKPNIIAQLDNYANDPYVVPYTKIPLPGSLFARAHKSLVDEKKSEIFAANDAKGLLKILFDMRTTLIGMCSDDLLGKVNTLILDIYTMLEHAPQMGTRLRCAQ
jgi:hypothetical protein